MQQRNYVVIMENLDRILQDLESLVERLRAYQPSRPEEALPPLAAAAQPDLQPILNQILSNFSQRIAGEGVQVLIAGLHRNRQGRTTAWYEQFSERNVELLLSPELSRALEGLASLERIRLLLTLQAGLTNSADLMRESGLTQGQFYHHLRILEANDLVRKKGRDQYEITSHGVCSLFTLLATASYILSGTPYQEEGEG